MAGGILKNGNQQENQMEIDTEIDIRCLISDKKNCPYREIIKKSFGYDIPAVCPYRRLLKSAFESYLAKEKILSCLKGWQDTIDEIESR